MNVIGEMIRKKREEAKLRPTELAEKLGLPKQRIWEYESGYRQPRKGRLEKILAYLDRRISALRGRGD